MWDTPLTFLQQGYGDYEEHAVLLANYFLWIADRGSPDGPRFTAVRIVIGRAFRYDEVMFVWTVEQSNQGDGSEVHYLWDPCRGRRYPRCGPYPTASGPLRDVSVVFDHTNVWCNVQQRARPRDVLWDLSKRAEWCPLFPHAADPTKPPGPRAGLCCPTESLHERDWQHWAAEGSRVYTGVSDPDYTRARELKEEVREWVKDRIKRLRRPDGRLKTVFDKYTLYSGKLALDDQMLPLLEEARAAGLDGGRDDELPQELLPEKLRRGAVADGQGAAEPMTLRRAMLLQVVEILELSTKSPAEYFQVGMPVHIAWRDADQTARQESKHALGQLLDSCHVHSTDPADKDEFAVGAYACPYECGVMSVWVFVASFRPRPGSTHHGTPRVTHRRDTRI